VKLHKHESTAKDQILSIALPQDFVGLINIFAEHPVNFSITALEDSVICKIDLDVVREVISNNGKFALEILGKISEISNDIIDTRFQINSKQLRGRVAYILTMFAEKIYHSDTFLLPLSRKEIGELISMTTENVIRIISEFKKEGILEVRGKTISILNPSRLEILCRLG
jgi:CRP/FNR family transcriptional regulator